AQDATGWPARPGCRDRAGFLLCHLGAGRSAHPHRDRRAVRARSLGAGDDLDAGRPTPDPFDRGACGHGTRQLLAGRVERAGMMGSAPQRKRRWPLSPGTVRAVLSGHSLLGLAFAAIIYLVCLTGTIAVFAPDLERWEQPQAPAASQLSDAAVAR